MKHASLCLTVLLLGGVPLTAAAFDYGPNRPLLAAENGAPQLPVLRDAPAASMAKPDVVTATSAENPGPSTAEPRATRSTGTIPAPPPRSSTASNKARANAEQPAPAPGPATWQSLLPGSIQ